MADILAIVSKAVFEAGAKGAAVGQVLPLDRYTSNNKGLEPVRAGGRLFLVTVRPPDEKLWLVAVLESPKHDGTAWVAKPNRVPITDVTALRGSIKFTSGAGISATKGALGMSLQTPRELTANDVALLLGDTKAASTAKAQPAPAAPTPPPVAKAPAATKKGGGGGDIGALLDAERWADALAELLRRWQADRAPELADLIERVSQRLPTPTVGKSWRAAATEAATDGNLSALLAGMTEGKFAESLERIQALEALPPDPRIAAALTRYITTPPFTAQSSREFWSSLYEQLAGRHADPRTLATVRPLVAGYLSIFGQTKMGEAMQKRARALVASLEERFPSTPSADVAALAARLPAPKAAEAKKTKGGKTLDELLAAVYESPDDDGARLVYADALLEAGDPRGDFITLQFKRHRGEPLSAAEEKQEAALLKKHVKEWLGPLYDVLYTTHLEFRRGFLYAAQIRPVAKAIPAARNHPAWSTIRELNMSTGGTNERGASLITQPSARHIRVMTDVVYMVLEELAASTDVDRALEVLEVSWLPMGDDGGRDEQARRAWRATLTGKAFPHLRELHLGHEAETAADEIADLWDSPLGRRLELVSLAANSYEPKSSFVHFRHVTKKRRVAIDFGPLVITASDGGRAEIRAAKSRWSMDDLWKKLPAAFDPATWREITLGPEAATDAQEKALAKHLPKTRIRHA